MTDPTPTEAADQGEAVEGVRLTATADICDAFPDSVNVADLPLAIYGGVVRFSGQVETVRCFEDNSMVRAALETPGRGRVLIVDGGGSMRVALLGDRLAALAIDNGWTGVVVDGCVRDTAELAKMPIGVRARGSSPRRSNKRGRGQVGLMLRLGRLDVRSGWWLYADEDGVLTMPHEAIVASA